MQVTASATDSTGAVVSESYNARPRLQTVSVSSPVAVTINGFTAASLRVVAGQNVTVAAPATQQEWTFRSWSDGGARSHNITAPAGATSYVATFASPVQWLRVGNMQLHLFLDDRPARTFAGASSFGLIDPWDTSISRLMPHASCLIAP